MKMLPFGGDLMRQFSKSPCSGEQRANCAVCRAGPLWRVAAEAGTGTSLLVLSHTNTLGLVFVVLLLLLRAFA